MIITLITQEQHDRIKEIKEKHPILTFENKGYDYINKNQFTEEDKKAFDEVTEILKNSIKGFSSFNNFRDRNERIQIRLQYEWTYDERYDINGRKLPFNGSIFTGVGYIYLDELINGFDDGKLATNS